MNEQIDVNLPENYASADQALFSDDLTYQVNSNLALQRIKYAIITSNGLVFDYKLSVIKESILLKAPITLPNIRYILGELINKKIRLRNLEKKYIVAFSFWSVNYFHWFSDTLPRLLLIDDQTRTTIKVLLPTNFTAPFFRESLNMLGFSAIKTIAADEVFVGAEAIVPPYTAETGYFNPVILKTLAKKFHKLNLPKIDISRKIYVSRKKADKRKVINEQEIEGLLAEENFAMICFEDYSFAQQVAIMQRCTHLISIHGAGLTNMLFMNTGAKVMELRRVGEKDLNCYFTMASCLAIRYYYLTCETEHSADNYSHTANLKIDVVNFRNLLKGFSAA